jgi:diguanylate cyclase (GGDEF)-like protein/PAS domain S-box-containing protein
VNEDWTAGERVFSAGPYDPRTMEWYKAAVERGEDTIYAVYNLILADDLSLSATKPVLGMDGKLQGVLVTHILLSSIGTYLEEIIHDYQGYSIVIEKDTGALIANSMGMDNFIVQGGAVHRYHIGDIGNIVNGAGLGKFEIPQAYEQYIASEDPQFLYQGQNTNQYINIKEINMGGLDWVIITGISEELLLSDVVDNFYFALLLAIIALFLSFAIYYVIARKLMRPMYHLLHVSEAISSGDLTSRVPIVRNGEIGRISTSFNMVADKVQYIIDNLEATVEQRTKELSKTAETLKENKEQLRLILDSAGEGIYGNDTEGFCTFCNISCVKMLGYEKEEDLLGKHMHELIHHSRRDGTHYPAKECKILDAIKEGKGLHADDEVFWRADGTSFDVEYRSNPQIRNGEIVGSVIIFYDITERREKEARINYLSYHDTLTGLYNRQYYEESRNKMDQEDNLPLSVIFADINGLKMTNDIFGHEAGDALIKKSAEILLHSCRQNEDIVARVGGDEFMILLPKTDHEEAKKIMARIRSCFAKAKVAAIKCSISIGAETKTRIDQSLDEIIVNAENAMYKDKSSKWKAVHQDIFDTIIDTLHSESPREKSHSEVVSQLCGAMGAVLNMTDTEVSQLKRVGYLHDIGKIALNRKLLSKDILNEEEKVLAQQHVIIGYRILNLFDNTLDLAEYVYYHHENWDGTGYPKGLIGDGIPQISRIISIAETYERACSSEAAFKTEKESIERALQVIKQGAGKKFDPRMAQLFLEMMEGK